MVEMVVISVDKSTSKGVELVVSVIGDVDAVVGGVLLDLVPGTMPLNLAAVGIKSILNSTHQLIHS